MSMHNMKNPKDFVVEFKTKDNIVVMQRQTEKAMYIKNGKPETDFVKYSTDIDSRQKGVRIVSTEVNASGVFCIVEWLK